jgi:hypothetical protein
MRLAVTTVLLPLCWAACSVAAPEPAALIEQGKTFSLKAGESARTGDGTWRIGFDGVAGDSRCPKGVQCVWAGDATVRIWLQRGTGPREARELHTATTTGGGAPGPGVRLVRLDPTPVAGKAIAPADYIATLTLDADR